MADSDITIVGLQAIGGQGQIALSWAINDPNALRLPYLRFDKTEVRRSLAADMSSPISLGFATTAIVDLPVPRGERRYYQARALNASGQAGEWGAVATDREISGDVLVASPGYWKLPSGLILQWGFSAASDASGLAVATFAIPFPNDVFVAIGLTQNGLSVFPYTTVSVALNNLQLTYAIFFLSAVTRVSPYGVASNVIQEIVVGSRVWWIAIGY